MNPLTVPGIPDSLELIKEYVLAVAAKADLTHAESYRLRLAIDEIATNIILHGYAAAEKKGTIIIQGFIKINKIIIQLQDFGTPFDPAQAFCTGQLRLSAKQPAMEGGLGIFLALSSVDHFYYERLKSGNRSTFILYTRR
ncbi:MAG: anti-sigma regulatory factor [Anaerolineales bacterium]|nr:anti-sigma regulatory factor [Anaerolineales bacterium]MCA9926956.1 anti-sigma regulatory factor [Anaerolineales bacterium]